MLPRMAHPLSITARVFVSESRELARLLDSHDRAQWERLTGHLIGGEETSTEYAARVLWQRAIERGEDIHYRVDRDGTVHVDEVLDVGPKTFAAWPELRRVASLSYADFLKSEMPPEIAAAFTPASPG